MNRKYKDLSKNVVLFTISSFGSKILVFLLTPLYTSILSGEEFGTADLINTTVNFVLPILLICVESGVLRFCLEKDARYDEVFSSSASILLKGTLLCFFVTIVAMLLPLSIDKLYIALFFLTFAANGIYLFLTCFCRGADRVGVMIEMSLLHTALSCLMNILFLAVFKWGVIGYMAANFLGTYISIFWGIIRLKVWKYFSIKKINKPLKREIRKYCLPLIFNKIGWWINNSIDKYVVTFFLGTFYNGIFSVAYKIPTILSTVSGVFADAWAISAIKEFDPDDSDRFVINMYDLYNTLLVIGCSGLIILNIPIATILYQGEFFIAWKYTGPLLLSVIFGALSGFLGCICSAVKDTKIYSFSTIVGGLTNLVISIVLIKPMGVMGVAIGTVVSNVVIWLIRFIRVRKHIKLRVNIPRDFLMYGLLIAQFIVGIIGGFTLITVLIQVGIFGLLLLVNAKRIKSVILLVINKLIKNKKA